MSESISDRAQWLKAPPKAGEAPWYAFRSVSTHWVNDNPRSRENVTRALLERLFGKPFTKVRPAFLKDPASGQRWPLELDAYNGELKLAAEFHGVQHYLFPNIFHGSNRAKFDAQVKRDALKMQLCEKHGIKLVVIPHTVRREDIELFLLEQLIPYTGEAEDLLIEPASMDTTVRFDETPD